MSGDRILGQENPGASNTTLYSLPLGKVTEVKTILIVNTGATDQTFRIFVDPNGSTFNASTALFWDTPLIVAETKEVELSLGLDVTGASIGVYGSSTDVTFTVSGREVDA